VAKKSLDLPIKTTLIYHIESTKHAILRQTTTSP